MTIENLMIGLKKSASTISHFLKKLLMVRMRKECCLRMHWMWILLSSRKMMPRQLW